MSTLARTLAIAIAVGGAGLALLACGTRVPFGDGECSGVAPLPSATVIHCDAGAPGATGCDGLPKDPWVQDAAPSGVGQTFPRGCMVEFPHANPYYQCSAQTCSCEEIPQASGGTKLGWLCPL